MDSLEIINSQQLPIQAINYGPMSHSAKVVISAIKCSPLEINTWPDFSTDILVKNLQIGQKYVNTTLAKMGTMCHRNEHVNNILDYKDRLIVPGWYIDCNLQSQCIGAGWCCFNGNEPWGSISTLLSGNGRGKLDFGNVYPDPYYVKVYLDGSEIASASKSTPSKIVEFDYNDGSTLKIQEEGITILQFNSFEVIGCR